MKGPLSAYMDRAGIRSNRELAELTGIKESTLDRIVRHPQNARGFQITVLCTACGITWEEYGQIITKGEKRP